jgi:ribosomal protein S18 acetylase RimI-like enzyme
MLTRVTRADVFATLESYYDAAPRANATTEEVGPFTVFVKTDPDSFDYYARPRLGLVADISRADVDVVRARQRELGLPENLEWVHETTPSLLAPARASGLLVEECPLLVLADPSHMQQDSRRVDAEVTGRVRLLDPEDDLASVVGAIHAGFDGVDEVTSRPATRHAAMMRAGLLAMAAAYDGQGDVLGGGSHGARGVTTELTGIAVLPRARRRGVGAALTAALVDDARSRGVTTVFLSAQDDAVARVYERVGFVRVGTACIAEPPGENEGRS